MSVKAKGMIDEDDPRVSTIGHPAPPWMVSYADLMSEMVCFFVILYALSASLNKNVQAAKKAVEEVMKQENVAGEVKMTKDGMSITFQEQDKHVFFDSGKADMTPDMIDLLKKVAPTLKGLAEKQEIVVEGHTDNIPSKTYPSNWELSTARATNVVHYLMRQYAFNPRAMAAVGYGEYHPIAPNDTPENRSKNRRVVFFIKNSAPPSAEPKRSPAPESSGDEEEAVAPEEHAEQTETIEKIE